MLGLDGETILVNGKVYYVTPPTIKKMVGCAMYMSDFGNEESLRDYFMKMGDLGKVCKALSWLVVGDESKAEDFMEGTLEEIVQAIDVCWALVSAENFYRLSLLGKNVQKMIANQR